MHENIIIRKIPLPFGVRAFTIPDSQGDYNVYINANLSPEQQIKSLEHEKNHIQNDDFIKSCSAVIIEKALKINK